jgi:hypothetical protein
MEFTKDVLVEEAKKLFEEVAEEWTRMENQPDTFDEHVTGSGFLKTLVHESPPAVDMFSEKAEPQVVETEDEIRHTFTVVPKTDQEKEEVLLEWRAVTSVTPRQARLELAKRGLLANIDTIIASLPADQQDAVKIEWEYAVAVERSSVWVQQLGVALGLDDAGLDDLFKAAERL